MFWKSNNKGLNLEISFASNCLALLISCLLLLGLLYHKPILPSIVSYNSAGHDVFSPNLNKLQSSGCYFSTIFIAHLLCLLSSHFQCSIKSQKKFCLPLILVICKKKKSTVLFSRYICKLSLIHSNTSLLVGEVFI